MKDLSNAHSMPGRGGARAASESGKAGVVMIIAALATVAMFCWGASPALAQGGEDFVGRARALDEQAVKLEEQYLKPAILRSRYKVETRFNNAKVAYLLKDYPHAALLFVGLVENPEFQRLPSYPEALYLLGDSLKEQRNLVAARKYFERVIQLGSGPFYQGAVVNLLELSASTNNYEGIDELYSSLAPDAQLSPAVNYVRGKVLFRQKRYAEARRVFQNVQGNDGLGLRAAYYRGVSFAAEGELENARQVFDKILAEFKPKDESDQRILDLTYLGAGRVAYESGDYPYAIDYYQHLKRTSPYFDQMLYELTWALVAQGKYHEASRVTDIFLFLENPDPTFVPKVKLLKADLHLRLKQYDQASAAYDDVVDTFLPVKQELESFADGSRDLETFFQDLVASQMRGERPDYMPALVHQWVENNREFESARLTIADLTQIRENIAEANLALEQMDVRLASGTRIQSFPELAEGMVLAAALSQRVTDLDQGLVQAEYQASVSQLSGAQKQRWEELEARRKRLQARYDAAPRTEAQLKARTERIDQRFAQMRRDLDALGFEIDSQKDQLDAVEQYLAQHANQPMDAATMERITTMRQQARADIAQLRRHQAQLRNEISVERQRLGLGDDISGRDEDVRSEYAAILADQRDLLAQAGASAPAQLAQARQTLATARTRLERFTTQMQTVVAERSDELRQDLARERAMLHDLDQTASALMADSSLLTAHAAQRSFMQVKRDFGTLVMRGDIGLIDVAWQKKEDMSRQINQLFEDRTAELKTLQEAFEEVR